MKRNRRYNSINKTRIRITSKIKLRDIVISNIRKLKKVVPIMNKRMIEREIVAELKLCSTRTFNKYWNELERKEKREEEDKEEDNNLSALD